jgi:hypothetical protein
MDSRRTSEENDVEQARDKGKGDGVLEKKIGIIDALIGGYCLLINGLIIESNTRSEMTDQLRHCSRCTSIKDIIVYKTVWMLRGHAM